MSEGFRRSALSGLTDHIPTTVSRSSGTTAAAGFLRLERTVNGEQEDGNPASVEAIVPPVREFKFGQNLTGRAVVPEGISDSSETGTESDSVVSSSTDVASLSLHNTAKTDRKVITAEAGSSDDASVAAAGSGDDTVGSSGSAAPASSDEGAASPSTVTSSALPTEPVKAVFDSAPVHAAQFAAPVEHCTDHDDERKLAHMRARIHLYEPSEKRWIDKGRGIVRLFKKRDGCETRCVMHAEGTMALLLNSPVFGGTSPERISKGRSLKLVLADNAKLSGDTAPKVFLLTSTTVGEADMFLEHLTYIMAGIAKRARTWNCTVKVPDASPPSFPSQVAIEVNHSLVCSRAPFNGDLIDTLNIAGDGDADATVTNCDDVKCVITFESASDRDRFLNTCNTSPKRTDNNSPKRHADDEDGDEASPSADISKRRRTDNDDGAQT